MNKKKKNKKKKKLKRDKIINEFKEHINKHKNKIWTPNHDIKYNKVDTNSWFDIDKNTNPINKIAIVDQTNKCIQVDFNLNLPECKSPSIFNDIVFCSSICFCVKFCLGTIKGGLQ